MINLEHAMWSNKYRPLEVSELIATDAIKNMVQRILDGGSIENRLFVGPPGIGKTTIARLLCDKLGCDYLLLNASLHGNIDILRNEIQQFASTVSFSGGRKYVILDEADGLNINSTQPALRGFIEAYSENCGFILTANYQNRLLGPLVERLIVETLPVTKADYPKLAKAMVERCDYIFQQEGVAYEKEALARYVMQKMPNWRGIINGLQGYAQKSGMKVDVGILAHAGADLDGLYKLLKQKDFPAMRGWIVHNVDHDLGMIYTQLSDYLLPHSGPSAADLLVTLGKYQYQAAFVADQELNLAACLAELSVACHFS